VYERSSIYFLVTQLTIGRGPTYDVKEEAPEKTELKSALSLVGLWFQHLRGGDNSQAAQDLKDALLRHSMACGVALKMQSKEGATK
jgi:hypothetical protein